MNTRLLYIAIIFSVISSCQTSTPKEISPAFYYWKSAFKLSKTEKKALQLHHTMKLYVKFFDVSWNSSKQHPQMDAPIRFLEKVPNNCSLIPVVFITNQTLIQLPFTEIELMADGIFTKIQSLVPAQSLPIPAIQLDCDWTLSTKKKYFALLNRLQQHHIPLSATIRLHQVKFFEKTGIPPVQRGMLMCYNMSDWKKETTKNSIYTSEVLAQYIQRLSAYPLPLDVAMPIFHWTIIYRNNRFLTFVNNVAADTFEKNPDFEKRAINQVFIAKKDLQFQQISIRKGDIFRCESVPFEDVLAGSQIVINKIPTQKLTFALYHLDEKSLTHYSYEQIQKLFRIDETLR
jgi:hypothetical protein